jgi:hypothetical protein
MKRRKLLYLLFVLMIFFCFSCSDKNSYEKNDLESESMVDFLLGETQCDYDSVYSCIHISHTREIRMKKVSDHSNKWLDDDMGTMLMFQILF